MTAPEPAPSASRAANVGRCPACGGTARRPLARGPSQGDFTVTRCSRCGLGITTPAPAPEEIAAFYPPTHYGSGGPRYRPAVERLAVWFRRRRASWLSRLHRPGAVLEVGCGHGYMLAALRDLGWTVQGVELHESSAAYGRNTLHLPIAIGDLVGLRLPAASFDMVVFWHSFEHLPDPAAALREAVRILKPGGLVVVAVPNASSWQARWAGPHWFHWEIPRHLFHFDPATLASVFRGAGLECALVSHANWEQNPFGWMQSVFNKLGFPANQFFAGLWAMPANGRPNRRLLRHVLQRLLAPPLLLGGFVLAAVETICRQGSTVTVVGRIAVRAAQATQAAQDG
jgi:SAM-dependent methyltransferase